MGPTQPGKAKSAPGQRRADLPAPRTRPASSNFRLAPRTRGVLPQCRCSSWPCWRQRKPPVAPEPWQVISILVCAIFGSGFAIAPFYFEYKAEAKAIEIAQLTTVTKEINKMETVAQQITEASENWEAVQETSAQTAKLAEEIAEGIGASVKEHDAFMAKAGTDELRTLKLEVEKSQQMEKAWANTLVGVLDLVYRLEQSAVASGKENFIETMRQFQGQCREVSRQVGLVAFEAENDSAFDADLHAMPQGEPRPADDAKVSATRLPGFRLQGKLVRKPLVAVG